MTSKVPVPIFAKEMPTATPRQLLAGADDAFRAAALAVDERGRRSCAHLAILRAETAMVAAKANPVGRSDLTTRRLTIHELAVLVAPAAALIRERIDYIVDNDLAGDDLLTAARGLIIVAQGVCAS